ncbi:MAG: hypothetical protein FWC91_03790 [Defluviitaleaceae bacterium]|nr:hypothetical protein [Defluviitaleaceae bacterium]
MKNVKYGVVIPCIWLFFLTACGEGYATVSNDTPNDYHYLHITTDNINLSDGYSQECNDDSFTWQEAFASILREYYPERASDCGHFFGARQFLLHDMTLNGIPEMFVVDNFEDAVTIYTFSDNKIVSIDFCDDIALSLLHLFNGAARTTIRPTSKNIKGLVYESRGPAGRFGTSFFFVRMVIDDYKLVIADIGEWDIDFSTIHNILDSTGHNIEDDELRTLIWEHTHLHINGEPVSQEELDRVFGREIAGFRLHDADEENIHSIILGW